MSWLILFLAGILEIGWAVGLKYTDGFRLPLPTALTVMAMVASVFLLGLAMRTLPLGTAYAIWTGIGTIGTVILGIYLFNEPANLIRLSCIALIVMGIAGLKLSQTHTSAQAQHTYEASIQLPEKGSVPPAAMAGQTG